MTGAVMNVISGLWRAINVIRKLPSFSFCFTTTKSVFEDIRPLHLSLFLSLSWTIPQFKLMHFIP